MKPKAGPVPAFGFEEFGISLLQGTFGCPFFVRSSGRRNLFFLVSHGTLCHNSRLKFGDNQ